LVEGAPVNLCGVSAHADVVVAGQNVKITIVVRKIFADGKEQVGGLDLIVVFGLIDSALADFYAFFFGIAEVDDGGEEQHADKDAIGFVAPELEHGERFGLVGRVEVHFGKQGSGGHECLILGGDALTSGVADQPAGDRSVVQ